MILKGPAGFGRVVNAVMNVIMCSILSFYVLWTVQNIPGNEALPILTPLGFFVSLVESFCVGMLVGDFLPALSWGQRLAKALHAKGRIGSHFISVFVLALVMITSISFVCTWLNNVQTAGMAGTWEAWLMVYPFLLVSGYVVELISLPLAFKIAAAISGFDPSMVAQKESSRAEAHQRENAPI